jgi:DNA repair protein RadC
MHLHYYYRNNHPSGTTEASNADINLTKAIVEAMNLFDIRVLDHIIVGKMKSISMSEKGYM